MERIGSRLAWVAVGMALIGTMVRWYESYLIGADIGHIPVSNLFGGSLRRSIRNYANINRSTAPRTCCGK